MMIILIAKSFLLLFLLIIVFAILFSNTFVHELIYINIFSLVMALLYLVMQAPDVAITEAAVGACISTLLLVLAAKAVNKRDVTFNNAVKFKINLKNIICFVIVMVTGAVLLYAIPELPNFGQSNSPINNNVYEFYLSNTTKEFGFPNVVTAILAGFRAYDTLGETVVVFTAGIAVASLLHVVKKENKEKIS